MRPQPDDLQYVSAGAQDVRMQPEGCSISIEPCGDLARLESRHGLTIEITNADGPVDSTVPLYVRSFLYRLTRGWYLINRTHNPADNPANGWLLKQFERRGDATRKGVSIHQRVYHLDGSTGHFTYVVKYAGG